MLAIVRKVLGAGFLLPLVVAASGCGPLHVNAFAEPGVVFNYRSYAWAADDGVRTGDPRLDNNRFFSERVRESVDRELAARGFEKSRLGSSDLVIHYHATITQEIEISAATDRFEHCNNCGSSVYDAGTLVIDLVDARSSRLVWRGWAENVDPVIDSQDWMEETIDRVVAAIIRKLPSRVSLAAAESSSPGPAAPRRTIEFSPASPFIRIYAVQFAQQVTDRDEILVGGAYTNIKYDFGRSHAPTGIIGYRRYLWRGTHVEYQLWPSYNWFYETNQGRYYNGAELWNEFRPGYTFDFRTGDAQAFVNLQYLIGFGLYGGNKPQSFKDKANEDPVFTAPMAFMGWRF